MRARLATATALLLALPLAPAATASKPKPVAAHRCQFPDPAGDVYLASPAATVPGDHVDITCVEIGYSAHAYEVVIQVVRAGSGLPTGIRFELTFTVGRRAYAASGVPTVRDEARNEYRILSRQPTLPASWAGAPRNVSLTLYESVDGALPAAIRRDDLARR